ncbi:recombinase family protein [Kitasatospora sp. LaBMicrA B282]|uniref:recombinase family protein n=1 Tax=Kitasatospora sp. LaBMicrA B282 TaxID=3420949 RepID=UPI003D0D1BC6
MTKRIGGYARISLDKDGDELGIDRQREDYTYYAAARVGWEIVRDYIDNDASAYRKNVVRPEFERLLNDLKSGVLDGVVAYDLDRLMRQPMDLERLIGIFEDSPKLVFGTVTQDYDLSTSDGRTMARVMVTMANKASADASRRIARKHRELADAGKNGGSHRAFGWNDDRVTVKQDEASLILEAHDALLAGTRLSTITRQWQALDVKTARKSAKPISRTAVKAILSNWRLCGYRAVKGEIHYGKDGNPVIAEWESITTPERVSAVREVLAERSEKFRNQGNTNGYRYLLTGVARCSECGARMVPKRRSNCEPGSKRSAFSYACPTRSEGGCGKVSRQGEALDSWITTLVHDAQAALLAAPQAEMPDSFPGEARLIEIEAERAEYLAARRSNKITASTLITLLEPLENEQEQLKRDRSRFIVEQAQAQDVVNLSDDFERLPIERQKAVIMKHVKAVIVHPVGKGARKFDPRLIEMVWT